MTGKSRYDTSALTEAQFEPDSDDQVLRNRRGIKSREEMDQAEAKELERTIDTLVRRYDDKHRFTAAEIRGIHGAWLEDLFDWAGQYRRVNLSKDGFPFAMASRVPALMAQYENDVLERCTPCNFTDRTAVVRALAEAHVELVLIHPFRDGNGRVARMLSTLMALQAGLPLLDFRLISGEKIEAYFASIQAGLDRNYRPMEVIFTRIIEQSDAST